MEFVPIARRLLVVSPAKVTIQRFPYRKDRGGFPQFESQRAAVN